MTAITVDRSTVEKLRDVRGPVQLRDEHGVVIGEFRPAESPECAGVGVPPSEAEPRGGQEPEREGSGAEEPHADEEARRDAIQRMIERVQRARVAPEAFPITRESLHERR